MSCPLNGRRNRCWTHRDDIVVDGVEGKRIWEPLRARQFADGDHTMTLRNPNRRMRLDQVDNRWTNIRVQNARLFSRRLNIRNRCLEDEAFIQPPVQSCKRKVRSTSASLLKSTNLLLTWSKTFPCDGRCRIGELPLPMFLLQCC